jgi:hypothetical protein
LAAEVDAGVPRDGLLIAASDARRRVGDYAGALAALEQVADRSLRVRLLEGLAAALTQ